jgi:predicted hotdog family 3-hydroxylacyl-ACP dehydratase
VIDTVAIDRLVPHRGAMSLLDAVIRADDATIEARVTVRDDGLFASGDGVPVLLAVEYMAQTVAAFAGARAWAQGGEVQLGLLLGVRNFTATTAYLAPGEALAVAATLVLESAAGLAVFDCRVTNDDGVVASARLTVLRVGALADLRKAIADGATLARASPGDD